MVLGTVETEERREFLANHGCMAYQGYLFGQSGPIENLMLVNKETV